MLPDPVIEEVRKVRHKMESECEDDPEKFLSTSRRNKKNIAIGSFSVSQSRILREVGSINGSS